MADPNMRDLAAAAMAGGLRTVPIPSEAQRQEVARVQGMQVRTNAANLATEICKGQALDVTDWLEWAETITRFITGEDKG